MRQIGSLVWLGLASQLTGCDSTIGQTRCAYTAQQIAELETRASAKDRFALRELDICYGSDDRTTDQQRVHEARRQLQDPELLKEDAMNLVSLAEKQSNPVERRAMLGKALKLAERAATSEGKQDSSEDSVVQLVTSAIEESPR